MKECQIKGLLCPHCGGTPDIAEGSSVVACTYCGKPSFIHANTNLPRYYILDTIGEEKVKQMAFNWFDGPQKASNLKYEYKIEELFLSFMPFYYIHSKAMGWILGKPGKAAEQTRPREVAVNMDFHWTRPACDLGEFGVKTIDPRGENLLPFNRKKIETRGRLFEPTLSKTDAEREAGHDLEDRALKQSKITLFSYRKLFEFKKQISILFYPVWILRYNYRNRTYQMTLDAVNGEILSGKAPGNTFNRILYFTLGMLAGNFLLSVSIHEAPAFFILLIPIALLAVYIGFIKLRYGAEYIFEKDPDEEAVGANELISALFTMDFNTLRRFIRSL